MYVSPGPFEGDYLLRVEAHFDDALVSDAPPQLADAIDAVAAGLVTRFPEPAASVKEEPEAVHGRARAHGPVRLGPNPSKPAVPDRDRLGGGRACRAGDGHRADRYA